MMDNEWFGHDIYFIKFIELLSFLASFGIKYGLCVEFSFKTKDKMYFME